MYKKGIIKEIKKPAHTCEGKENSSQNFRGGKGEKSNFNKTYSPVNIPYRHVELYVER